MKKLIIIILIYSLIVPSIFLFDVTNRSKQNILCLRRTRLNNVQTVTTTTTTPQQQQKIPVIAGLLSALPTELKAALLSIPAPTDPSRIGIINAALNYVWTTFSHRKYGKNWPESLSLPTSWLLLEPPSLTSPFISTFFDTFKHYYIGKNLFQDGKVDILPFGVIAFSSLPLRIIMYNVINKFGDEKTSALTANILPELLEGMFWLFYAATSKDPLAIIGLPIGIHQSLKFYSTLMENVD